MQWREGAEPRSAAGGWKTLRRGGNVLSNYPRRIALGTEAAAAAVEAATATAVLTSTNIAGPGSTAKRR